MTLPPVTSCRPSGGLLKRLKLGLRLAAVRAVGPPADHSRDYDAAAPTFDRYHDVLFGPVGVLSSLTDSRTSI